MEEENSQLWVELESCDWRWRGGEEVERLRCEWKTLGLGATWGKSGPVKGGTRPSVGCKFKEETVGGF